MKKTITYIFLVFLITTVLPTGAQSQDVEPADVYLEFISWKYNDMSRSLMAKISSDNEEGEYFVAGIPVIFLLINEEEENIIGEAITGNDGIAELQMADGTVEFPKDEEGYIQFIARFEGNEAFGEAEEELMIKDVIVSISFEDKGDEKLVYFEGTIIGPEEDWPLADDDFYFYVPRMFSDMKIADGWFEEDGTGYIEFPANIIGDSIGNVMVFARLEDHYEYGNVEVIGEINWATPKKLFKAEGPARELWTPIAPLWMIITLIIMLAGVWGHYFYAIFQLIKIKSSKS